MNNYFSFQRLGLLIKKQFSENVKLYLYGTLALLGLLAIVMVIWIQMSNNSYRHGIIFDIYFIGLYISGSIFASYSFNMLESKDKGINWLTLPASHGEKLICVLFYNIVVFTIVYTIVYFIVSKCAVFYIQEKVGQNYEYFDTQYLKQQGNKDAYEIFSYAFFGVQAFYVLGSVGIKRFSFVFTTAVGALLIIAFILLIKSLSASFSKYGATFNIINANGAPNGVWQKQYFLNHTVSNIIIFLAKFIWAPFFWLVIWFRLKEKEI